MTSSHRRRRSSTPISLSTSGRGSSSESDLQTFKARNFMTFTEAAIEVLRREGKPLHFRKIAEIAAREDLLDHVGKIPEETMAGQLVAHCRLPRTDRRVIAVQHGTFALVEWGLDVTVPNPSVLGTILGILRGR